MPRYLQRLYHDLQLLIHNKPYLILSCSLVLGIHLFVMIYSQIYSPPPLNPNRQKLIVKTMLLPPDPSKSTLVTKLQSRAVPSASPAQKKQSTPLPVKQSAAKPTKQASSPSTKKQATTPPLPSKTKQLLSELQESIAKIETNRDNILPTHEISIPTPISALKADAYEIAAETIEEEGVLYRDMLIHHLKDSLHLPGYGTVKVELTLTHQGSVQHMSIIYSDSEVNRLYLEHSLEELMFPPFIGELANKKTYTFCLTFCSDQ